MLERCWWQGGEATKKGLFTEKMCQKWWAKTGIRFGFMEFSAHFRRKYFSSPLNCSIWNCFDLQANISWWDICDSINTFLWWIKMRFYKALQAIRPDISSVCSNSAYRFATTSTLSNNRAVHCTDQSFHFVHFMIIDFNEFLAIPKKKKILLFLKGVCKCVCVCVRTRKNFSN